MYSCFQGGFYLPTQLHSPQLYLQTFLFQGDFIFWYKPHSPYIHLYLQNFLFSCWILSVSRIVRSYIFHIYICKKNSCFQGGFYLLTLVDWYAATFSIAIFALIELIVMTYVYGKITWNIRKSFGVFVLIRFSIEKTVQSSNVLITL